MDIKGIIFDFDGTLADTLPLCINSFQLCFEKNLGKKFTEEEIIRYFGQTEEGIIKAISPDNWEDCFKSYLEIYKNNHSNYPSLFDGIIETLDHLKDSGLKIAMVTGKGSHSAEISLNFYGIDKYFEYVETGSPDGSIKPEGMKKILQRWGIKPENAVYVGDNPQDIIDSKEVGVLPIGVSWASTGDHSLLEAQNPHIIFSEISDFKAWLKILDKTKV